VLRAPDHTQLDDRVELRVEAEARRHAFALEQLAQLVRRLVIATTVRSVACAPKVCDVSASRPSLVTRGRSMCPTSDRHGHGTTIALSGVDAEEACARHGEGRRER